MTTSEKGWTTTSDRPVRYYVGNTGVVHAWGCPRLGDNSWEWTPRLAISTDRAHAACLPDGLPRA